MGAIVDSLNKILGTNGMTIAESISEYNGKHQDVIADAVDEIEAGGGSGGADFSLIIRPQDNQFGLPEDWEIEESYASNTKAIRIKTSATDAQPWTWLLYTSKANVTPSTFDKTKLIEFENNQSLGLWSFLVLTYNAGSATLYPEPTFVGTEILFEKYHLVATENDIKYTSGKPFILVPYNAADLVEGNEYSITVKVPGLLLYTFVIKIADAPA